MTQDPQELEMEEPSAAAEASGPKLQRLQGEIVTDDHKTTDYGLSCLDFVPRCLPIV